MPRKAEKQAARLVYSILEDRKLDALSDLEYRVWTRLLVIAAQEHGGFISDDGCILLAARGDGELLDATLDKLIRLGIVEPDNAGWRFTNWDEHNPRKPSDDPEAVRLRVAASRARAKARKAAGETVADVPTGEQVMESSIALRRYTQPVTNNAPLTTSSVKSDHSRDTGGVQRGGEVGADPPVAAQPGASVPEMALSAPPGAAEGGDRALGAAPERPRRSQRRSVADPQDGIAIQESVTRYTENGIAIPKSVSRYNNLSSSSIALQALHVAITERTPEEVEILGTLGEVVYTDEKDREYRMQADDGEPTTAWLRGLATDYPGVDLLFVSRNYRDTPLKQPPSRLRFKKWVQSEAKKLADAPPATPSGEVKAFSKRFRSFRAEGRTAD